MVSAGLVQADGTVQTLNAKGELVATDQKAIGTEVKDGIVNVEFTMQVGTQTLR